MTHTDNIEGLIERLEKAAGPSRELDCLIAERENPERTPETRVIYYGEPTGEHLFKENDGELFTSECKKYTESIDAALGLVPEGWLVRHSDQTEERWRWSLDHETIRPNTTGAHASSAIALCIAALKAQALRARTNIKEGSEE